MVQATSISSSRSSFPIQRTWYGAAASLLTRPVRALQQVFLDLYVRKACITPLVTQIYMLVAEYVVAMQSWHVQEDDALDLLRNYGEARNEADTKDRLDTFTKASNRIKMGSSQ